MSSSRRFRVVLAVLALVALVGAGTAQATPPVCAAAWSPTVSYGTTHGKPNVASKACGSDPTIFANYPAAFSSLNLDPCIHHGASNTANPWLLPTGCGTIPVPSGGGVTSVILGQFDTMFPTSSQQGVRSATYNLTGLANGGAFVTDLSGAHTFVNNGDTAMNIREMAAFMANSAHETSMGFYIDEVNKQGPNQHTCYCQGGGPCGVVCDPSNTSGSCTATANNWYYGRGWLQLSWDFNYCNSGIYLGTNFIGNANVLSTDATLTTEANLWYWMTQHTTIAPNVSAHDCIVQGLGFGCTIAAINGPIECNASGAGHREMLARGTWYTSFISVLNGTKVGSDVC